ncbi:RiPP maturation radical SAM C-methyltransferase [Micromonospora sp. NPDC004336]
MVFPQVTLVAMPWQAVSSPSLPLGLLRTVCVEHGMPLPVTYHGSIHWAEYLLEHTDGEITPQDYGRIAEEGVFDGIGDWIFTGTLYEDAEWSVAAFREYAAQRGLDTSLAFRMRRLARSYMDEAVARVLADEPRIVGFSTTFMQNVPSLALARRIKAAAPETTIVFGGGNCDGPMGVALHNSFADIDYVVRGEAERAFPQLLHVLAGGGGLADIPALCWRDGDGNTRVNPQAAPMLPASMFPKPDYDDWFSEFESSPIREYLDPTLVLESARGCWWGELHHCTFCGLNGSVMTFRAKEPERFVDELTTLVGRHRTLDVMMVDNIIDNDYFHGALPRLAALDWDFRLHYEVKANLSRNQIAVLRSAGVMHVQPGIESLVSSVLKLMDKGVSAVHNVRVLRDGESAGLTVSWNWLVGFPGETEADYAEVLAQLPALVHLQPPTGACRVVLERFSPYFERPELGFAQRRPSIIYRHTYDLPESVLADLVYLFDTEPAGIDDASVSRLAEQLDQWQAGYANSRLVCSTDTDGITILDRRVGWPQRDHHITDERLVAAYRILEEGHSVVGMTRKLDDMGVPIAPDELAQWLDQLRRAGLTFVESGRILALATTDVPVKAGR